MGKKHLSEDEKKKRRKAAQEDYRHRVLRFNLQFNLKDAEAREWFERQGQKGEYLKNLILADKAAKIGME